MLRIAITGNPGVGKSTVCCNVLKRLSCAYGGMVSADLRENGERIGFEVKDIATGKKGILSHKKGKGPLVGRYHVNLEDLNGIGVAAIKNALDSDLIVIDEIAPMELKSTEFIHAVGEALDSDRDMLVVLHRKSIHTLALRIRNEFEVYNVTTENRDRIVSEIAGKIERGETDL